MPLYQYQCPCGNEFERLARMDARRDVRCSCGKTPELKVSSFSNRSAEYFTAVGHDGSIIAQRQTTERTPMAVMPNGVEY
ncbi:hypothetical protein LCGC14_1273680 [marine sediment metagenome]|uniref:Putative regulatory protein FmdB zinc ribbon domain-containing protein n=1 Tax=marine sediment metagenome TaxID=412755 RepID=A0A0F9KXB4_9ZZZZ